MLIQYYYVKIAEVPGVARVLNSLSVDAVCPILLLYPPETPVPSLSCRNLVMGSLLYNFYVTIIFTGIFTQPREY